LCATRYATLTSKWNKRTQPVIAQVKPKPDQHADDDRHREREHLLEGQVTFGGVPPGTQIANGTFPEGELQGVSTHRSGRPEKNCLQEDENRDDLPAPGSGHGRSLARRPHSRTRNCPEIGPLRLS